MTLYGVFALLQPFCRLSVAAYASMVFVGNINQSVDTLVKTSHLLAPFPDAMIDSAFFDRFHAYIPGWEIPKMRPELFTGEYGLIPDGPLHPGVLHTVARASGGRLGLYRMETQVTPGTGKLTLSGLGSSTAAKEPRKRKASSS